MRTPAYRAPEANSETCAVSNRPHRRPVHGSVVLGLMPIQPQPQASWAFLFRVSETSPAQARTDAELFLAKCLNVPDDLSDMAVLLANHAESLAYSTNVIPVTAI
jgi:hypothetical protein